MRPILTAVLPLSCIGIALAILVEPCIAQADAAAPAAETAPPKTETAPPKTETAPPANGELPPMKRAMEQATVFARQATEAMRRGDWAKSRDMWKELLKLQPDSAAALSNLGSVEVQLNEMDSAREHLEKAVKLRPGLAATWMTLGLLYNEQKNPMLAISALTRSVHEDPSDARLHNALAIVLKQVGWINGAEQELQKAIDLSPDYAEAHFNLALLYLEQRPPALEMARRHYQKARDCGAAPDDLVDKQLAEAAEVKPDAAPDKKSPDKTAPPASDAKGPPKPAAKPKVTPKAKPAP